MSRVARLTGMAKPKRPRDLSQLARLIVGIASGEVSDDQEPARNPAAINRGRKGGLKGGPARHRALSPKKRSQIAKKAAKARWAKS